MKTTEERIIDLESRVSALEERIFSTNTSSVSVGGKERTLREIVKGKKFKNGQEQIAAIVGYHEKILGQCIAKEAIKNAWQSAKMNGAFAAIYLTRAKDTLIRILDDGTCDLTQTGEEFFEALLNN